MITCFGLLLKKTNNRFLGITWRDNPGHGVMGRFCMISICTVSSNRSPSMLTSCQLTISLSISVVNYGRFHFTFMLLRFEYDIRFLLLPCEIHSKDIVNSCKSYTKDIVNLCKWYISKTLSTYVNDIYQTLSTYGNDISITSSTCVNDMKCKARTLWTYVNEIPCILCIVRDYRGQDEILSVIVLIMCV